MTTPTTSQRERLIRSLLSAVAQAMRDLEDGWPHEEVRDFLTDAAQAVDPDFALTDAYIEQDEN